MNMIDIEKLIVEVEKRPCLYDTRCKEYSDKNLKIKEWIQVCAEIIPDWFKLNECEKQDIGVVVQKRWKNVRDSFRKELRLQKNKVSGQAARKRHKYIYFDQLLFLIPTLEERVHESNYGSADTQPELFSSSPPLPEAQTQSQNISHISSKKKILERKKKTTAETTTNYEEALLDIIREKHKESTEIDEDKTFLLSLVPSFRKLTEQNKFTVKKKILSTLQLALSEQNDSNIITNKTISNRPTILSNYVGPTRSKKQINSSNKYEEAVPSTSSSRYAFSHYNTKSSSTPKYIVNYNPELDEYEAISSPLSETECFEPNLDNLGSSDSDMYEMI